MFINMYIWLVMRWKKVFLLGRLSWSFNSMLKERDDNTKDQNCATFITSFVCLVLCLNSVRQTLSILISKCILLYKCSWLHVPYVHVNIAKVDWLIDWLIDWMEFYAVSAIFQPCNDRNIAKENCNIYIVLLCIS